MSDAVILTKSDGVLRITMNRPDKKNALSGPMYDAMTAALEEADSSDAIRAVVLDGAGGAFTAGNDLMDFLAMATKGEEPRAGYFIKKIASLQTPLVAAVDGLAVGVGATLLFHCDLVYATASSRFHMPFVDLGLTPEAGSSLLAPLRFGMAKAAQYILLGEPFDAEEAYRLGLINAVVAPENVVDTAMASARKLAAKPVNALKASRRLMRGDPAALMQQVDMEMQVFADALRSSEARAAFTAFLSRGKS